MCPAGPAVLRDVLVPSGAGVVDAVDVPPVPALGERGDVQVLVRPGVGPGAGRGAGARDSRDRDSSGHMWGSFVTGPPVAGAVT